MAHSDDSNVYIKRGKRYVPFGLQCGKDCLPDGIWYVRHFDNSYGRTNVDHYLSGIYKIGEPPEYIDIPKLCSMHSYTEYVMASPEFKELMNKGSYSFFELTAKIVALVVRLNQTLKVKEGEQNGTRQWHNSKASK